MEILHVDPVSLVPVLQQNVTLRAAVVCHPKALLTVCAERVTPANDVTGKFNALIVLNEALGPNRMVGSDFSLKL
jgi:hypothetical protein